MKRYQPRRISPNTNQFYDFLKQQDLTYISSQSSSYRAVLHLFKVAENIYRVLDFHTSESLAVFTEADKYLTSGQEHDLTSLTAAMIAGIDCEDILNIVNADQEITEIERCVLLNAISVFKNTATHTSQALGRPQWLE